MSSGLSSWSNRQNLTCFWKHKDNQTTTIISKSELGACLLEYAAVDISLRPVTHTVYPKKYAHGFVVLCFVVVMQSFIMNSHEVFIHIHQGCFAGTGAIVRLPQCQWSKPDGYGKISQYKTTTKHSKAKTLCIFLGIYCICISELTIIDSDYILSPSHCMNQCWNFVNWTFNKTPHWNFNLNPYIFFQENAFGNVWKMATILSRPQYVKWNMFCDELASFLAMCHSLIIRSKVS